VLFSRRETHKTQLKKVGSFFICAGLPGLIRRGIGSAFPKKQLPVPPAQTMKGGNDGYTLC